METKSKTLSIKQLPNEFQPCIDVLLPYLKNVLRDIELPTPTKSITDFDEPNRPRDRNEIDEAIDATPETLMALSSSLMLELRIIPIAPTLPYTLRTLPIRQR
jgi:hypothetical protein